MEFIDQLQSRLTKKQQTHLVARVNASESLFNEIINILIHEKGMAQQGAAWIYGYSGIEHQSIVLNRLGELVNSIKPKTHPSVLRNTLRVLMRIKITEPFRGMVFENCYKWAEDSSQPVAIRAFALHTMSKILDFEPELANEIDLLIDNISMNASSGLLNTCGKVKTKIRLINRRQLHRQNL